MSLMNVANTLVDAAIDKDHSGTTLEDFLTKFNSPEGKFVDTIDPKTTFDVYVKFYPTPLLEQGNSLIGSKFLNALGTAATGALKSAGNAITGGLLGSFMNNKSIQKAHDQFIPTETDGKSHTFMEYLLEANLVVGGENWFANQSSLPLELSLGPYVQEVTIPHITLNDNGKMTTLLGEFPVNGTYVKPDNHLLIMQILNTKAALHERIFYPWLREISLPYWSYGSQPYTTATITVDFSKHNDCKYVFCGCRPQQIYAMQGKQDTSSADNLTRQVTFLFDFMFIHSDLTVTEKLTDKLLNTTKPILNSAAHALNL